jgi:CBS-domain-containing membrane protein
MHVLLALWLRLGATLAGVHSMSSTVADIMNPKLLYIQEGDRLSLARAQILKFGVTAVPVLDYEHRPVGVVSLHDLDREDQTVDVSSPAKTVRSHATLDEGARALVDHGVHHLVVVDDRGVAVGMVSALDFVRALVGAPPHHPAAFDRY